MIKSKRDAFATHCGLDYAETEHYRYHYGHTSQPVWAFDSCYYCVTKGSQKPAKYKGDADHWTWEEVKDNFVNTYGYKIWKHTNL